MATATAELSTVDLREYVASTPGHIDEAAGVIRSVRILGPVSANKRRYALGAIQRAQGLYEGVAVFFDHPSRARPDNERSMADKAGWLENVRVINGGLTGDLHLLTADPRSAKVLQAARMRPGLFGLSHNAGGQTRRENGTEIVEEIAYVRSVDIVTDPATTRSLFESGKALGCDNVTLPQSGQELADWLENDPPIAPNFGAGIAPEAPIGTASGDTDGLRQRIRATLLVHVPNLSYEATGRLVKDIVAVIQDAPSSDQKASDKPPEAPASEATDAPPISAKALSEFLQADGPMPRCASLAEEVSTSEGLAAYLRD